MSSLRLALKQSLEEAAPPLQTKIKVEPKQPRSKNDRKRKRKLTKDRSDARGRDSKKLKQTVTSIDLMRKINSSSAASLGTDSNGRKGGKSGRSYLSGQSSSYDSDSSDDGTSNSSSSSSSSSSDDESSNVNNSKSESESNSSSSGSSSDSEGRENDSGSDGDGGDRADDDMEGVFDSERTSDEDDSPSSRKRS
jgi:hypothetical protein